MENEKFVIKLDELQAMVNSIFGHMKTDLKIDEVELTADYYWDIPSSSLYAVDVDMEAPTVGSLIDDLEFLHPLLSDKNQAVSLMLLHVAPLLRYIATKVGQ
jgi:hypothetical protein